MAAEQFGSRTRPNYWRIQNIKLEEKELATTWLQTQVQGLELSHGVGFSLATDSTQTLCATLTSLSQPTPPKRSWSVDKDFIGFTPLCDPINAKVDIVAVTGLGGHALGSFRASENSSVWLRDFAPEDVPGARFITYGYDTIVAMSWPFFGAARKHRHVLYAFYVTVLGVFVLKEALVRSYKATASEHHDIYQVMESTYGLILMGVPNLGLKHDQLETVMQGRPNRGFVRDLLVDQDREPSQFLSYLAREFEHVCKQRHPAWEIISYYETMRSPTLEHVEGERLSMTGPKELMVSKASAKGIRTDFRDIDHIPSNTDHRGLVRFEHPQDNRYRSMIERLRKMADEAAAGGTHYSQRALDQTPALIPKYLPFPRNKQFVGRSAELEKLERKLFMTKDCQRMTVFGLGGIGKTQVALRFASLVLEKYLGVAVFWVPAVSAETFGKAYKEIASVLGIDVATGRHTDVNKQVRQHLNALNGGRWLLIVDNADDMDVLNGLLGHLPVSDLGVIVFTTRSREVAQRLTGVDVVRLRNMAKPESLDILTRALDNEDVAWNETAAVELLEELDYLPLAITQAAAYMNCTSTSIVEYLGLLKGTEQDLLHIMSREMQDNKRYKESRHSVAATWLVSFQQILKQDNFAAELLQFMSCIEWKAIPLSMLPPVKPAARMTSAIGTLSSYSFITKRDNGKSYDMHRLVHLATRIWLDQRDLLAETQRRAMRHLSDVFPSQDFENREVWQEYIPHAARMVQVDQDRDTEVNGRLCLRVGTCFYVDGRYHDSARWLEQSCNCREHLAEDHPDRLASQHVLAIAYQADGQVEKAILLLERVVKTRKRMLAEDHPHRLASQHALASAYQADNQAKKAILLLEYVVKVGENSAEHQPYRLASQHALAIAYLADGQVKKAIEQLEHVVETRKRVLAENHPHELASQHALAVAYQADDQVKRAIPLLEHVVSIRKLTLAEDHPARSSTERGLAEAYKAYERMK